MSNALGIFRDDRSRYTFKELVEFKKGITRRSYTEVFEDFLQSSSGTLVAPWSTQDTSGAGTPTIDFVDDAVDGHYTLTHDAQSEQQNLTLYWGDSLHVPADSGWIMEFSLKINFAGAAFSADQRFVAGMCSARNATLDTSTLNAWFRVDGASLNLLWETDDNVTNDDDNDSGIDVVDNTFHKFLIDGSDATKGIGFYADLGAGAGWQELAWSAAFVGTGNLQPYFELQRDAGTEAEAVTIDYARVAWARGA